MSHSLSQIDFTQFEAALIMGQMKSDPKVSNGVGKSIIFHALEYAYFGTVPTETLDLVVREGSDFCQVTHDFEIDGEIYRIVRRRRFEKDSNVELFQKINSKWEQVSQRTSTETHNEIQKLIRINQNSFRNAALFTQGNIDGLISKDGKLASAASRQEVLKDAFNLWVYRKYEEIAKKQASKLSKEISILEGIIETFGSPEEDILTFEKNLKNIESSLEIKIREKSDLESVINGKRNDLNHLNSLLSSEASLTNERLQDVKIKKKQAENDIVKCERAIKDNLNKISSIEKEVSNKEQELSDLITKTNVTRSKKLRPFKKVKQDLEACQQNEINGKAYIASKESQINELKKPLPQTTECPQCHQAVSEEHREAYKAHVAEHLSSLLEDLTDKKDKLKKCTNKKIRLQNELDEIKKITNYLTNADSLIKSKESEVKSTKEYLSKLSEIQTGYQHDLTSLTQKLDNLKVREEELIELTNNQHNSDIELKIKQVNQELTELTIKIEEKTKQISEDNTNLGIFSEKIKNKSEDINKLDIHQKKLIELQAQLTLAKLARTAFNGIPAMIISNLLDELQTEMNKELAELKPSLEIQFTADANLLFKYHGKPRTFSQLSGGQKMSLAFASRIGLSTIIKRRMNVNIPFLGLDEVEQPFDQKSVENYADIIKKLQTKFKILVITHNEILKDRFSYILLVEGDEKNGSVTKALTF